MILPLMRDTLMSKNGMDVKELIVRMNVVEVRSEGLEVVY